jgi:hypothetical protein
MKTLLFITALFISMTCFSQNWVTNLQMQAGTWKAISPPFKAVPDSATFVSFNKLFNSFKVKPNDASNVTLDSIPTLSLVLLYEFVLFNVGYSGVLLDFQTSIQSKRATNALLDARCDELEARYTSMETANIASGGRALGN